MNTDKQVEEKFAAHSEPLKILNKTKTELSSMIPQSADSKDLGSNPTILAIKGALESLDNIKNERSRILQEALQKCENFNAVEDLILVHSGQAEKGSIYEKHIGEFKSIYSAIEPLEKHKAEVMNVIQQNMGAFSQLVSSAQADKGKQQFYQQLDQAVSGYFEITNMLHQANQFYTQLSDYLTKLFQNISDFKVGREFEKNDLIQRLSNFGGSPPTQFQASPTMQGYNAFQQPENKGFPGPQGEYP